MKSVRPVASLILTVTFNDGLSGLVNINELVNPPNAGIFAALRDHAIFNEVRVTYGAVAWPGEIDLAPEPMYAAIKRDGLYCPRAAPGEPAHALKRA